MQNLGGRTFALTSKETFTGSPLPLSVKGTLIPAPVFNVLQETPQNRTGMTHNNNAIFFIYLFGLVNPHQGLLQLQKQNLNCF